nr:F17c-G fimbrial adhesin [Paraburkholderia busanensis]
MKFSFCIASSGRNIFAGGSRIRTVSGLVLISAVLLLSSPQARADCSPAVNLGDITVNLPSTINVPANAAVGTIVATATVPVPGATAGVKYAKCSGSGSLYWAIRNGPVVANRAGTTSVAGIGYTSSISGGGFAGTVSMDTAMNATSVPGGFATPQFQSQLYVTVNLVKTGATSSGPLSINPSGTGFPGVAGIFYAGDNAGVVFRAVVAPNVSTMTTSACSVTTSSPTVTLPPVSSSAFQGIGSTAGVQSLQISLNCPTPNVRVFMTLTDNSATTNTSDMLSLKPGSTAEGVKLQILNADTPVSFGPDSAAAGNTNQWLVGTSTGGAMNVPLSARYVQSAAKIKPGSVNAIATFTMSYQ